MFDIITDPVSDPECGAANGHPLPRMDETEEPAPSIYLDENSPPLSVTEYLTWVAENDALEQTWAEQERALRKQEGHGPGSGA
jgi:hypothetical protein